MNRYEAILEKIYVNEIKTTTSCFKTNDAQPIIGYSNGTQYWDEIRVSEVICQKIQNSSKEELLAYIINTEYKYYISLIEYRLNL